MNRKQNTIIHGFILYIEHCGSCIAVVLEKGTEKEESCKTISVIKDMSPNSTNPKYQQLSLWALFQELEQASNQNKCYCMFL